MKKIYFKPKTVLVKVAAFQLMADSETIETKGNYGTGEGITLGSRDGDGDWDDE